MTSSAARTSTTSGAAGLGPRELLGDPRLVARGHAAAGGAGGRPQRDEGAAEDDERAEPDPGDQRRGEQAERRRRRLLAHERHERDDRPLLLLDRRVAQAAVQRVGDLRDRLAVGLVGGPEVAQRAGPQADLARVLALEEP